MNIECAIQLVVEITIVVGRKGRKTLEVTVVLALVVAEEVVTAQLEEIDCDGVSKV